MESSAEIWVSPALLAARLFLADIGTASGGNQRGRSSYQSVYSCYSASRVAELPMREKHIEYAGSGFLPFQKYVVLKSCQVDAMIFLFFSHSEELLGIISQNKKAYKIKATNKTPKTLVTHCLFVFLTENSRLISCLAIA